jgi:hypothetical protein
VLTGKCQLDRRAACKLPPTSSIDVDATPSINNAAGTSAESVLTVLDSSATYETINWTFLGTKSLKILPYLASCPKRLGNIPPTPFAFFPVPHCLYPSNGRQQTNKLADNPGFSTSLVCLVCLQELTHFTHRKTIKARVESTFARITPSWKFQNPKSSFSNVLICVTNAQVFFLCLTVTQSLLIGIETCF